jgi:predicted deacylase
MNTATANRPVTLGDATVNPGETTSIDLPVASPYTSTSLAMPVKVVCGREPGPVLFVSAAIHGDELNGIEIIRRLLRSESLRSLCGTLIAVPVVNVHGFLSRSRYLPDRRDLNRSFPGRRNGSSAARLAHLFMREIVEQADYGIDLHTGALNRGNLPQIRASIDDERTLQLAEAFGAPVIINSKMRDGSLRESAAKLGVPSLLYESGEALRFDEFGIRAGVRGVINVMGRLDMLAETSNPASYPHVVAERTRWVRAGDSGIVTKRVKLGARVGEGEPLAVISDPLGDNEFRVVSPFDGIVIGRANLPLAHEGDALFHIAAFGDVLHAEEVVRTFVHEHTDTD